MRKKLMGALLCTAMAMSMAACGGQSQTATEGAAGTAAAGQTPGVGSAGPARRERGPTLMEFGEPR